MTKGDKLVVEGVATSEQQRGNMNSAKFIEHDETLSWHVVVGFGGGKETSILLEHQVLTDGYCMVLCEFGVMPLFNSKLAVANVDMRADDCVAEFITGGIRN